ncbi:hypothetical protein B0H14DRAFT_2757389 [Mycena olivaceomarginata]|nr:hypothetical protein B0H14DRAFT_2757389 [Mycena olivaceomarginata]
MPRDVGTAQKLAAPPKDSLAELFTHLSGVESIYSRAISERDALLEALGAAEIRHEDELAQMQAAIADILRQAAHWEEQARHWQNSYSRVEQDLLALSRSVSMESPSNHISTAKRGSDQLLTPTKSKTGMPVTPRSAKRPSLGGADSSPGSPRGRTATHDSPRQICIRRVQAVVHVKEENDGQDSGGDEGSSDEVMMRADVSSVSPAKRRRTGTHEHIAASV